MKKKLIRVALASLVLTAAILSVESVFAPKAQADCGNVPGTGGKIYCCPAGNGHPKRCVSF
jgi:hypothetical protein